MWLLPHRTSQLSCSLLIALKCRPYTSSRQWCSWQGTVDSCGIFLWRSKLDLSWIASKDSLLCFQMENCCQSCCITKELSLCVFGRDSKTSPRWVHSAGYIWKRLESELVTIWEHPVLCTSKNWLTEFLASPFFGSVLVDLKLTRLSFLRGVHSDFCTHWSHKMCTLLANELYQVVVICSKNLHELRRIAFNSVHRLEPFCN